MENGKILEMNEYKKLVEIESLFSNFIKSYYQQQQSTGNELNNENIASNNQNDCEVDSINRIKPQDKKEVNTKNNKDNLKLIQKEKTENKKVSNFIIIIRKVE